MFEEVWLHLSKMLCVNDDDYINNGHNGDL